MRLRHLVTIGPRPPIRTELHPDADVTFVPMEAIANGLGGLDISQTRPFIEVASGSYNYFAEGDLLLAKVTPCFENGKKALAQSLSNDIGYATSEVHIIRPGVGRIHPKYLFYLLCSEDFRAAGMASMTGAGGLRRVSDAAVLNYRPSVTDLPTQKAIADFLDRETASIDQLIEKKRRMVEVLVARQESVRDGAVCKGLNPAWSYQESGVDWFGNVPAHWKICKFNRLVSSKVDYRGRTPEKVDAGVFLVTARNIRSGIIDYGRSREFTTEGDWVKLSKRGRPNIGDVIFTTEAPLGQIAQVDRTDVAFAQRIIKLPANEKLVTNDFLAQLMMSASFQRSLRLFASGSTADGIKSERLAHLFGLAPPIEEQLEIVAFIKRQIDRARGIATSLERSVERLHEFRSALITAAVTGQVDVSNWGKQGTTDRRLDRIEEATNT